MTDYYQSLQELFYQDLNSDKMSDYGDEMTPGKRQEPSKEVSNEGADEGLVAMVEEFQKTMGTAKILSDDAMRKKARRVYKIFSDAGCSDEKQVRYGLAYYFLVNGTSDKTEWSKAQPIIIKGAKVPATRVTKIPMSEETGPAISLRNFATQLFGDESDEVFKMDSVKEVMMERAMRAGLPYDKIKLINEMSKSKEPAVMGEKLRAKYISIAARERGTVNVTTRSARQVGEDHLQKSGDAAGAPGYSNNESYL